MLNSILRTLKGETIFLKTTSPEKYTLGSVIAIDVGPQGKSLFRVTGVTSSHNSVLYSIWGKERATSMGGGRHSELR